MFNIKSNLLIRSLLLGVLFYGVVSNVGAAPDSLRLMCDKAGITLGSSVSNYGLNTTKAYYTPFVQDQFEWVTVSGTFISQCPTTRGVYDWAALDSIVDSCVSIGKHINYNAITVGNQSKIPTWLTGSGFSNDTIRKIMCTYIDTLIKRYHGKIEQYEVCNELTSNTSSVYNNTAPYGWWEVHAGPHHWKYAYDQARLSDPTAVLALNDHSNDQFDDILGKGKNYLRLLDTLKTDGTQIDLLEMQWHMQQDTGCVLRPSFADQYNRIKAKWNLPIIISEMDWRVPDVEADTAVNLKFQAKQYAAAFNMFANLGIKRVVFWGWVSDQSWINTSSSTVGYGFPCLYSSWDGSQYVKTAAWQSVVSVLRDYKPLDNTTNNRMIIKINHTCVADSQANFPCVIDLHNTKNKAFWDTINTNRSNVLITDTNDNVINSYISGIDKVKKRAILNFTIPIYPDKDQYIVVKYSDAITTGVNSTAALTAGGIVFDLDLSNNNFVNKTGLCVLDSFVNKTGFTSDTNKYGYYLHSNGISYAMNKTNTPSLQLTQGTISTIFYNDSADAGGNRYVLAVGTTSGNDGAGFRAISTGQASNIIKIGGSSTTYLPTGVKLFDSTWHHGFFSWGGGVVLDYYDSRFIKPLAYTGSFSIASANKLTFFADFTRTSTTTYRGAVALSRVYNEAKTTQFRSTEYSMVMDPLFYEFSLGELIVFKSVTSTSHSYTLVDSLSADADSTKVFLWDSVSGGSKTLRDSTILLRGDTSFTFTRSGLTSGTTYYYWLYGRNNSGTWDSTFGRRIIKTLKFTGPTGTTAYMDITVNHAQISETSTHFLYQFKVPLNAKMKAACDSAKNFVVCTPTDTSKYPRYIKVFPLKDSLLLYLDAPTSTTVDKVFRLCAGKTINAVNSASAFTNSGITLSGGFDEFVNGTTTTDDASGVVGTITGTTTLGAAGVFGNGVATTANSNINYGDLAPLNNASKITFGMWLKLSSLTAVYNILVKSQDATHRMLLYTSSGFLIFDIRNGSANDGYFNMSAAGIVADTWFYLAILLDGTQATNPTRLKVYANGVQRNLTFDGTIPSTTPDLTGYNCTIGNGSTSSVGGIDNLTFIFDSKTAEFLADRYKMLSAPATFATMGAGVSVGSGGGNKRLAYKPAFKDSYR